MAIGRFSAFAALLFMMAAGPAAAAGSAPQAMAAFCRKNPTLDFPTRDPHGTKIHLPEALAAAGVTRWRCMDGKAYVCAGGAAGSACWKMDPSREPSQDIRETCEDNPGQDFVATAVIANSASTWRCEGPVATIIKTVPLDARDFMKETWLPLFDAHGKLADPDQLGADPR